MSFDPESFQQTGFVPGGLFCFPVPDPQHSSSPAPSQPPQNSQALIPYDQPTSVMSGFSDFPLRYRPPVRDYQHLQTQDTALFPARYSSSPSPPSTAPSISNVSEWRAHSGYAPVPLPPFDAVTRGGSNFTVYHVCQECHQPRSIRYHVEHPVSFGVPLPPSTVCHRCRTAANGWAIQETVDEDMKLEISSEPEEQRDRSKRSKGYVKGIVFGRDTADAFVKVQKA